MRPKTFIALTWLVACGGCDGELADKPAWAALQRVEFDDRTSSLNGTEVRQLHEGYVVLAITGRGQLLDGHVAGQQPHRAWIMLNEHASDKNIKQLGRFSAYDFRCSEVGGIEKRVTGIDPYVIRYLRSICTG